MERKIIQVVVGTRRTMHGAYDRVYALCNDGTFWEYDGDSLEWILRKNVPQPPKPTNQPSEEQPPVIPPPSRTYGKQPLPREQPQPLYQGEEPKKKRINVWDIGKETFAQWMRREIKREEGEKQ